MTKSVSEPVWILVVNDISSDCVDIFGRDTRIDRVQRFALCLQDNFIEVLRFRVCVFIDECSRDIRLVPDIFGPKIS